MRQLTEEQLKEVANKFGLELDEVRLMYERAMNMGVFKHKAEKQSRSLDELRQMQDELAQATKELKASVDALNSKNDPVSDMMQQHQTQSRIDHVLKSIEDFVLNGGQTRIQQQKMWNAFTSPHLQKEADTNRALKEFKPKPKDERKDSFYNSDGFNLFTSQKLNEPPKDNRVKTGNGWYDNFTSKRLNQ